MWKISKSFEFNYGHRIATQELNKEFALDQQCKC
jgi:6-pyruvoyltetrahydropterin/6-carboxytetrahydropterin synthase